MLMTTVEKHYKKENVARVHRGKNPSNIHRCTMFRDHYFITTEVMRFAVLVTP